ncbi:MAG: hypothetical protein AAFR11_05690 [Pseudomonadota bacterium]
MMALLKGLVSARSLAIFASLIAAGWLWNERRIIGDLRDKRAAAELAQKSAERALKAERSASAAHKVAADIAVDRASRLQQQIAEARQFNADFDACLGVRVPDGVCVYGSEPSCGS